MTTTWSAYAFEDLVDFHDHRRIPLSKKERSTRQGPFPYYGAQGVIDGVDDYIFDGKFLLIAEDGENLNSRKLPIAFFAEGQFWVNNHAHVVTARPGVADENFLRVYVEFHPLNGHITGAAQPKLSQGSLKRLSVTAPPFDLQVRIGNAVRALDGLIENNRRRVKILEEMARLIYREWFVHFRFPGHEDVELVDSDLGPIPDGWEVPRLAELVSTQYGYTESARDEPLGPKFLRGTDMNKTSYIDWSTVPYCPIDSSDHEKFRVHVGDIFVIRMADPGKVSICETEVDAVFASYLVRLRPLDDRIRTYYLFFTLSDDRYQGWVTGASTGATRRSVSAKVMTEPHILLPPEALQLQFEEVVGPMRELLTNLLRQNSVLRESRDLLLPRLVSGELDVSELELELAEVG